MTDVTPETPHFGLTRIGPNESVSKNGYAALDLDRLTLDKLLFAAFNHHHDGVPALGAPTYPPSLDAVPTSGVLPASTTYYYRVSYVDENGLETAASPEASVTTPDPIPAPTAPAATAYTGGTLNPGSYAYLITFTDDFGGETTPSPVSTCQVSVGTDRVHLDLPDYLDGATGYVVYRSRPGQSAFYYLGATTDPIFDDTGLVEDQTVTAPSTNSSNSANAIDVTVPGPPDSPFIPLGCVAWRIYRATSSGGYDGTSLVHEVSEGENNASTTPVTIYTDAGDSLLTGFPQNVSSTPPASPILSGSSSGGGSGGAGVGTQVLTAYLAGTPSNGQVITVTELPFGATPVRFTAHFQTPPTTSGVTVTFRVSDGVNHVDLPCSPATHVSGDPAGYFRVGFPLVSDLRFEAELQTMLSGFETIQNDVLASSLQAVFLQAQDDGVGFNVGTLEAGTYQTYATLRVEDYDTSLTDDLTFEIFNVDTSTVLQSSTVTLADPAQVAYMKLSGPTFTAPGGDAIQLRVKKSTTSAQSYLVDSGEVQADHTDLAAGMLTVSAIVSGGSTSSADANLAVWF